MLLARTIGAAAIVMAFATAPAWAGPPLICHAIPIQAQHSLPWTNTGSWDGADPAYDVSHLEHDTLALLAPAMPVEVRMETLRRAAIYSARGAGIADALAVALMSRVMNAQANGTSSPSAWFDAGYFAETLGQAAEIYPMLHGPERDAWMIRDRRHHIGGLSWMRAAVSLGGDAAMSAAVVSVERATGDR